MKFFEFLKSILGDSFSEHEEKIKTEFRKYAVPKSEFNERLEELKTAKEQLTERDTQIADLKKFEGTAAELQAKVDELTEENKKKDAEKEDALSNERKTSAMRAELADKVHDVDYVLSSIDVASVTYKDGKLSSNFKSLIDDFTKEKPFVLKESQEPTKKGYRPIGTPPPEGGDPKPGDNSPEAIGKRMAQQKIAQQKAVDTAANHYFN